MTWSDYNNQKGFHVFDTETREIEFIRHSICLYLRNLCMMIPIQTMITLI